MTLRPDFPAVIDNSMRSCFKQCPRKFQLEYLEHWRPNIMSIHLHAGICFAHGVETVRRAFYVDGLSPDDALAKGWTALVEEFGQYAVDATEVKTVDRMASALVYYFTIFPLDSDFIAPLQLANGERVFEFSFAEAIDVAHPVTGHPILYYGRFDMLGQHANGDLYVTDEKTAKQLGASWVKGWSLDAQMTGYCWGARRFDFPVSGALIRGISILKNGHGHAQSVQTRSAWEIERWYGQLCRDVESMKRMWAEGYFDYDLAGGCKSYGGCGFLSACKSPEPERWLEVDFARHIYAPWLGAF